mmetsp:Transcript_52811/g.113084  ORF Transcript_52811/g.113084 Transcript_52811/m.113084 type:complete len:227 (+) Transcript_52811:1124-1804(+)
MNCTEVDDVSVEVSLLARGVVADADFVNNSSSCDVALCDAMALVAATFSSSNILLSWTSFASASSARKASDRFSASSTSRADFAFSSPSCIDARSSMICKLCWERSFSNSAMRSLWAGSGAEVAFRTRTRISSTFARSRCNSAACVSVVSCAAAAFADASSTPLPPLLTAPRLVWTQSQALWSSSMASCCSCETWFSDASSASRTVTLSSASSLRRSKVPSMGCAP